MTKVLAKQPDALPTRKLTAFLVVSILVQIAMVWLPEVEAFLTDPRLVETIQILEPILSVVLPNLIGATAAYHVRDFANLPLERWEY